MSDDKRVNESLAFYLEKPEYKNYKTLIQTIMQDGVPLRAKYNLWALLMNTMTKDLEIDNLTSRLKNIYYSDSNLAEYVDSIIDYNPKLGYVSISAKERCAADNSGSLSIDIPVKSDYVNRLVDIINEVLTMILVESRAISPR
jgi:hypothetical protein